MKNFTLIILCLLQACCYAHTDFSIGFLLHNVTINAVDLQNTRAYTFSGPTWGGTANVSISYRFFNYAGKPSLSQWLEVPGVGDIKAQGRIDMDNIMFADSIALGLFTYNAYPFPGDDEIVIPYTVDSQGMLHIQQGATVPSLGVNPGLTSWTIPPNQLVIDDGTAYTVYNITRNGFGASFWKVIAQASYGASGTITSPISFDPLQQITASILSGGNGDDAPVLKYAFVASHISPEPLVFGKFPEWKPAPSFALTQSFLVVTPWVSQTVFIYHRPSESSANSTKVARFQMPSYGINSVFQDGESLYILSGGSYVNRQDRLTVLKYSTVTWSLTSSFDISCATNCPLKNAGYGGLAAVDTANRIMLINVAPGMDGGNPVALALRY